MSNDKATINRLNTGVPGLDEVLGGGLPEFSFNLLAGSPGCGKTTLAHQIMFALATPERPAIYFTVLGEPPLKMLRYQQQFDYFDNAKVNGAIRFINLAEDMGAGDLDKVLARIVAEVEALGPGLVFVDSFRSVMMAGRNGGNAFLGLQQFVQQLGMLMTSWQATTFLIGEYFSEADPNPVFTVADGLIWLRQSVERNSVVRKIEITKMRGQPLLAGLHTFRISAAGIRVFPPAQLLAPTDVSHDATPNDERLSLGVPGLDAMMGGGLPRGFSLLVAGPSGSGKSVLAAAFLAAGARSGEAGIVVSFEQRPSMASAPRLAGLIASGRVSLITAGAGDLSVDEIAMLVSTEIRRTQATRVVIDSLSSFELSIAPTFREDFRESMLRMVKGLIGTGATVVMTSELEDRYDDLRFSPYGTAFLTDAIIVQRYIEVDSQLQRLLSVVKLRGSAHSIDLRRFTIGDHGIEIGEMLTDYEGLLGGRPTLRAGAVRPVSGADDG